MFIKFKAETTQQVAKIKYEGQDLVKIKEIAATKLKLDPEFDLYYIDEENEQITLTEESDWKLCLEIQTTSLANTSTSGSLTLMARPTGTVTVQPKAALGSAPQKILTESTYPQPPAEQKLHTTPVAVNYVTVTASVPTFVPSPPPADLTTSALFGGVKPVPSVSSSVVHINIVCDRCGKGPIVGVRYKSLIDNDFDLCEKCITLDEFKVKPFIRIPYYSDAENKGVWNAKEFVNTIKSFKGKFSPPEDPRVKAIVDQLKSAFPDATRDALATFTWKHANKDYAAVFAEYIKAHYLK